MSISETSACLVEQELDPSNDVDGSEQDSNTEPDITLDLLENEFRKMEEQLKSLRKLIRNEKDLQGNIKYTPEMRKCLDEMEKNIDNMDTIRHTVWKRLFWL